MLTFCTALFFFFGVVSAITLSRPTPTAAAALRLSPVVEAFRFHRAVALGLFGPGRGSPPTQRQPIL